MPLTYDDTPGCWGEASKGWPTLFCVSEADADRAFIACSKGKVVPYGSYVRVGNELRVETPDLLAGLITYLRATPYKTYEGLRDHYKATGLWG